MSVGACGFGFPMYLSIYAHHLQSSGGRPGGVYCLATAVAPLVGLTSTLESNVEQVCFIYILWKMFVGSAASHSSGIYIQKKSRYVYVRLLKAMLMAFSHDI